MGGGSQILVFTIPSEPTIGQKVAFVAWSDDPARTIRLELWVENRKVKVCNDSVCLYQGGPFPPGRVTYAANAFDAEGNRSTSGWHHVAIQAGGDTEPPVLQVQHRPQRPTTGQKVTILAQAGDPGGVGRIEIRVAGELVRTCAGERCSYTGGPFAKGMVGYEVSAYDGAGNRAWSGRKWFVVTEPKPSGEATISGRITGQRAYCKAVAAFDLERPGQPLTAPVDASGAYRIANVPDGRYRVAPLASGKFDLLAQPRHRDLTCQGSGSYTVGFEIEGISEG